MTENEIGTMIVDSSFKFHTTLGPGWLETVYQASLAYELEKRGLKVALERSDRTRNGKAVSHNRPCLETGGLKFLRRRSSGM